MIVTLIVLLYLAWETYNGYKTGFTRYIINLIFAALVFMIAIFFQNPLGNWMYSQFTGQQIKANLTIETSLMLFRFAAFFIILFLGRQVVQIFKSWIPSKNPNATNVGSVLDSVLGGFASFIATYFFIYVLLSMLNAIQNPWFMQQTVDSPILKFIIYNTPGLSNGMFNSIFSIGKTVG